MNRIDTQFFEHMQNIPVIDLHGLRADEVRETLNFELNKLVVNKCDFCRVVHGVGEGVLARIIEEELSQNPLVEAFFRDSHGGSTTVRFYPHR